jgi:hypothetical protein
LRSCRLSRDEKEENAAKTKIETRSNASTEACRGNRKSRSKAPAEAYKENPETRPQACKTAWSKIRKLEREKEPCDAAEAKPQDYVRDIDGTFVGFHGFLPGAKLSEQQLQAERRRVLQRSLFPPLPRRPVRSAKTILYCGKLDQIWGSPLGAAKWIAEEIRTDPWGGWRLLAQQEKLHWKEKGYVLKMWRTLIKYLADQKPLFREMDYQIADIVQQHPDYTIQEITSALYEQDPKRKWDQRKWDTLERYVRRFLKNVPRL